MTQLRINPSRLHDNLERLAEIGKTPDGGVTRVAFTNADIEGREFVKDLMRNAGLAVRIDPVGNIFSRREGNERQLPAILLGSHTDTVPDGGAFDGALGVLAAVEVAQTLTDNDVSTDHPLEVVVWSDEEGGMSGSRAFTGNLPTSELDRVVPAGVTLREGIGRVGGDPSILDEARCAGNGVAAYVELHIEQGSRLESQELDIGIVTGIVAIRHHSVTIKGAANHAGTTPMDDRRNALLAACDFVLTVDRVVRSVPGDQVGTVGDLKVRPCAPNVIPGDVRFTVELRDMEMAKIDSLWSKLEPELSACATRYATEASSDLVHSVDGVGTDPLVEDAIVEAAASLGLSSMQMPSGAGHDAQNVAKVAPCGMIFVPSVDGVSHSASELTRPEDCNHGADVLLRTLLLLDRGRVW